MFNKANISNQNLGIREAVLDDLTAMHTNECLSYRYPWSLRMMETSLIGDHLCLVMQQDGCLVGHMILERILDEVYLYNVCVLPKFRRQGKGHIWIDHLYQLAFSRDVSTIHLETRISNKAALQLYLNRGFEQVGYRKGYYRSTKYPEDAIVMLARL